MKKLFSYFTKKINTKETNDKKASEVISIVYKQHQKTLDELARYDRERPDMVSTSNR